ncbi:MAG TPA: hypothetical protein PKX59_09305 [Bacteroidia bacterium]|nr:hypothetical protein [Bacteroidia bacterium]
MNEVLKEHPYVKSIIQLSDAEDDRYVFHQKVAPILVQMGNDKEFLKEVVRRNLTDEGYLSQTWTLYNIPYFFVYENEHINIKIHLFPRHERKLEGIAAHCIHHHNNYLLTSNAFFGSGYESMLFEKELNLNEKDLTVSMKIRKHFHQKEWNPSLVDSWEPHVVFIPEKLSATLVIWTPDKKRNTDNLRANPILKAVKGPLRWAIHAFGLTEKFGIAAKNTYQFYPEKGKSTFKAIEENEYFAPTRAAKGAEVDEYSMRMIFDFLQQADLVEPEFLKQVRANTITPAYYYKWLDMVLNNQKVPEVFHREEINIPIRAYTRADIQTAAGLVKETA